MSEVKMIVAVSRNGVIGKDGDLPWGRGLPEDLRTFKELTMGGVLYVGKKTASNLPPLKGREVVVLNRDVHPTLADVGTNDKPEWIIGGAAIYNAALAQDVVDRVYLSVVDKEYDGDTFFSMAQFRSAKWELVSERTIREAEPVVKLQEWLRRR
jgi:dihydrofolate reductase